MITHQGGRFLEGIWNGYANEVLFKAGISPFEKHKALSEENLSRLHWAIPKAPYHTIGIL